MPSMRDQFRHLYIPDEQAVATAMQTGLITPDTNVLLNLYRFQNVARDQLFGALETLGDRLWIPHQVGLEFHRNRLSIMKEQEEYFGKVRKDLDTALDDLHSKVRAFRTRISLSEDHVKEIADGIALLREVIGQEVIRAEKRNDVRLAGHATDAVLARIDALFETRVGGPMEPEELEEAKQEAKRRAEAGIPPGYKDRAKADPTGDYLVWRQLMTEAKNRKVPVVLVTDDRKEDWYRREHGLTLGARYELREEMTAEADVELLIMTTETFLLYAERYLQAEVSDATIAQAKELPGIAKRTGTYIPSIVTRQITRDFLESENLEELHDVLIDGIRAGAFQSPAELAFALDILSSRLERDKTIEVIFAAVDSGVASGDLTETAAVNVLNALRVLLKEKTIRPVSTESRDDD